MSTEIPKRVEESLPGGQAEQALQWAGTARARKAGLPLTGCRLLQFCEEIEGERERNLSEKLAAADGAQQTPGERTLVDVEWIGG